MRYYRHVVAGLLTLVCTAPAHACGDKLAAVGGGVRYDRMYRSAHPARIVLYAPTAAAFGDSDERQRIAASLARAGHQVEVVTTFEALDARLRGGDVQLVLAEPETLPARLDTSSSAAIVALRAGDSAAAAVPGCAVALGPRGRHLVRSVERLLEQRSRGDGSACAAPAGVQGT